MLTRRLVSRILGAFALLVFAALAPQAAAQGTRAAQAEVKAITGKVEVLRKGQTQWAPASVGLKLVEGDEIRSWGGASAQIELADATSLLVSENSRLAITKLDAKAENRVFHLSVGKVRATLAETALKLVQSRQSNFAITTPGGVAAARGTDYVVSYDPTSGQGSVDGSKGAGKAN